MSRIRSIHPGFFTDEDLVSVSMGARLLFLGIGVEADDKGVFVWKPLTIKMRIFPADNVDVPSLLSELEGAGAIRRYEIDGKAFGAIRNFRKFQKPKTPNDLHPATAEILAFVGFASETRGSDDAPFPSKEETFPQKGEIAPQMEEGGGRREDGIEEPNGSSSPHIPPARKSAKPSEPKAKKVPMTMDWQPVDLGGDVGDMLAEWPPGRLDSEITDFREYWIEQGEKRPGWDRTFRARIRTIHARVMRDRDANRNQNDGRPASGYRDRDRGDGLDRYCSDRLAEIDRSERSAGAAGRPDAGDGQEYLQLPAPS